MLDDLEHLSVSVWSQLAAAIDDPQHPYWLLSMATVGLDHSPESRLLVLREVDADDFALSFHTDIRSQKWKQLGSNPDTALSGYDPINRVQVRFKGKSTLFDYRSEMNQQVWNSLSMDRKKLCSGDIPANPVNSSPDSNNQYAEDLAAKNFGIIRVNIQHLDWLILDPASHRRALIDYAHSGLIQGRWVNP